MIVGCKCKLDSSLDYGDKTNRKKTGGTPSSSSSKGAYVVEVPVNHHSSEPLTLLRIQINSFDRVIHIQEHTHVLGST